MFGALKNIHGGTDMSVPKTFKHAIKQRKIMTAQGIKRNPPTITEKYENDVHRRNIRHLRKELGPSSIVKITPNQINNYELRLNLRERRKNPNDCVANPVFFLRKPG